jgi:hypothetical protein
MQRSVPPDLSGSASESSQQILYPPLLNMKPIVKKVLLHPFISFSTRLELHLMLSDLLVFGRSRGTRLRLLY